MGPGAVERLSITTDEGNPTVITIAGELDPVTAPDLMGAVDAALARGSTALVIDLAGVTFIDSSGLRALISAHKLLDPEPLVLRRPTAFAQQLLEITGLDNQFVIESQES
jgi:anti-sigma B factor antagonist